MPASLLIRLRPVGPWRIGPESGARDRVGRIFPSDALYAAVCAAMEQLDFLDAWLDATARSPEPEVRLGSLFPYQRKTMFAVPPKHVWPPAGSGRVRWKGARFIPLSVVDALLRGEMPRDAQWRVDVESECLVPAGADGAESSGPFRVSVRSAAAIDREGHGALPHQTACLEFARGSGLWTVATFASEESRHRWRRPLMAAFRLLADSGMGGERSRGWGRSEAPQFRDGELSELLFPSATLSAAGSGAFWMLSLYHPAESDPVDWNAGNYEVTSRGGRVESRRAAEWGSAKKPTRMVAEGSVIAATSAPVGKATDVAPQGVEHPVYRAGFAVSVPVPLKVAFKVPVEPKKAAPEQKPTEVTPVPERAAAPKPAVTASREPEETGTPLETDEQTSLLEQALNMFDDASGDEQEPDR